MTVLLNPLSVIDETFSWLTPTGQLTFSWSSSTPVRVVSITQRDARHPVHPVPLVEALTAEHGSLPASGRLGHTAIGDALRYRSHRIEKIPGGSRLSIEQTADRLSFTIELDHFDAAAAIRSRVVVRNDSAERVVLLAVTSFSCGFSAPTTDTEVLSGWQLASARSDWLGENRWRTRPLRGEYFVPLSAKLTHQNPRGAHTATSTGTWSTGKDMPFGVVFSTADAFAMGWQIEHNGAWRWEIGEDNTGAHLALSGPTDADSGWSRVLDPGESFLTVPVTVAWGRNLTDVAEQLTRYRRVTRRPHSDNTALPVVFNDYMNTLNGDPTTDRLLPLVRAAAAAGAEVFCIDAGWYDDSGDWWDTVGEWAPSTTRFPNGLEEVIDEITAHGMIPGLWLEPEVIGVNSPLAKALPVDAFLQRHGIPLVEHRRRHLDMRSVHARAHVDTVIDDLIERFGIGFFKFDYNINPGPGTDFDADSIGDGLLDHNRAHLEWLDALLDRHPELIVENCGSGAMRADWAMLSRLAMQSTSDQQDFTKFPPIAVSAPMTMLPEQAANWAYPQPEMTEEEVVFCLVTGLLGRFYVSGYLNQMDPPRQALVAEAITVAKQIRMTLPNMVPSWPLGLPGWEDVWLSLAVHTDERTLVSVWYRDTPDSAARLHLPHLTGHDITATTVFPRESEAWETHWDRATGVLTVHPGSNSLGARLFSLVPRTP